MCVCVCHVVLRKSLFLVRMVDLSVLNFVYQPSIFRIVVKLKLGSKDSGAIVLYLVHLCAVSLTCDQASLLFLSGRERNA